jgi:TolB-like protein
LNYEERSEYKITITATDKGSLSVSEEYTIKIKDVAEFSTITSTEFEVSETLGDISETYIGDIQYTNPENLANINYNLVSNSEKFEIRANKLYLKTGEALDYEDTSLYRLAVMSDEEASLWQYIDILVIAKNQKPSIVPVNFQVDENTIIIGSVKCIDDDKNIKMELIDSEEFFYFEGMTIKVQKDKVLDYEEFKQKTIRVRAFDGDLYSDILDIDIVINNINEPPVIVSDNFVIAGRELNIGKIQAYDPDGDLFRLQIKNSNGLFFIDGDELKVKSNKLYDKIEQHFVVVEAYDGELISEKTIELTVVDFNDPPIVETAIINVFENSDIRREIKYYDSDNDDVVLRLSKTSDLFVIQDNQLRLKNEFNVDFERQKEHYIYVIANDGLLDSNPFKIKIQVLDENDNKPVIKTDNINISCKLENNALIGVLEAEDLDSKTILNEWTILEGNIDAVSLNPESGELRIKDYRYINEMSNLKYMVTVGDGINISDPSQISLSLDKDAYKKQNFESIILYPSFNNGNFNLFSYSYIIDKLIVVSQSGKILMNIPVNSAYKRITTSLPDGSYMVKIYYMDESKNRKVIVKKMIVSKIAYN